ncbi:type III pantothenate kinase [bacterium]|nr:type III pantothenate kinase [bacterium]
MLLTVDIGNTNITLGIFDCEGNYVEEFRLASDRDLAQKEYELLLKSLFKDYKIKDCIISSVVNELNVKFKKAVDNVFELDSLFLTCSIKTGITVGGDNPQECGADRIANAAAVSGKYNKTVIVVDFGTATTFDIVNEKKELCGGVIAPGIKTQLKSLEQMTSKLPEIDVSISPCAVGNNTKEAILSGVIRGTACMVDGLIEQCEEELGQKVILVGTGGYCGLISNYMKHKFNEINPILTLEGLKNIYNLNKHINSPSFIK